MVGYLQLAALARTAEARVRAARDLEARWQALGPAGRAEARAEWGTVADALEAVRERLAAGPRGFVREFRAAYRGEEAERVPDPRPLGELVRDLHRATEALRDKLDALPPVADAPGPAAALPPGGDRADR